MDPSGLGRKIDFDFVNVGTVPATNGYSESDLTNDLIRQTQFYSPINLSIGGALYNAVSAIADDLWNSGTTRFLDSDNRPIIYGTQAGDALNQGVALSSRYLKDYVPNGVVYVAGPGNDFLTDTPGPDVMIGGAGEDTADFSGNGSLSVTLSAGTYGTGSNGVPAVSFKINAKPAPDLLIGVENVILSSVADTVKVAANTDLSSIKTINAGTQASGTKDVLDFSQFDAPLSFTDSKLDGIGTTFTNFEKLILTNKADTLKITSLSNLGGLNEIDAGANPAGTYDTVDLSKSNGAITFSNNTLNGNGKKLQLNNFEKIIVSSARDTLNLTKSSITWADGAAGNDVLTGGTAASILIGGDGTDQLFAGNAGDTLEGGVSNGAGDSYAGGRGADTFIIGNGTHAKQGIDAKFNISNAGANDRLVLRLSDTAGANAASAFTKGIVLSGGIQPLIWLNDGRVQTPHAPDPNHLYAVFSSVLVKTTGVTAESGNGRSSAQVNGKTLEDARSELGEFVVYYDWNKSASTLDLMTA
jgi:hypothetical protein